MEENLNYSLDIANFTDIPFQKYVNDFVFIVNGKRFPTNRVIADALSPIVRNLHYVDGSTNEFNISTSKKYQPFSKKMKSNNFKEFLNLAYFGEHELTPNLREEFSVYFYILGNIEEYLKLQPDFNKDLNINNAIERLSLIENVHSKNDAQADYRNDLIEFIASNFEFIDKTKLNSLSIDTVDEILCSEKLSLVDEDSILNFVLNLYQNDRSYSILFKSINFENLSNESFCSFIENFQYTDFDRDIWNSVCYRLSSSTYETDEDKRSNRREYIKSSRKIKKIKKLKEKEKNFTIEEFRAEIEEGRNRGMIHFLTKKTGGNIHDNGTVEIWSNSINMNDVKYHPKNLFDFKKDNFFASNDSRLATISIDFKDRLIQPKGYKLKTCNGGENSAHLKNWVFEVSNDNQNWILMDRHENEEKMRGRLNCPVFNVEDENNGFYRFVRIRQTGESWYTKKTGYYFILREFEIYGKLKELSIQKQN